jgi:hypothetical protein
MRRILPFAAALALAGCATRPAPQPEPEAPAPQQPQIRSDLTGMTTGELIQRFGQPALQVREGRSLKLQFRGRTCILDAYLYPPVGGVGPEKVMHVDTRLSNGSDTPQAACIASLTRA